MPYGVVAEVAVPPEGVDESGDEADGGHSPVVFVVVEGRVADVLRPGVAGKSSHLDTLN